MSGLMRVLACAAVVLSTSGRFALADGVGQEDLDEALRAKVTAEDLRDLNEVIKLLESALDKGLDVENSDFAEQMLGEALLERSAQLAVVLRAVPDHRLADPQMQRVKALAVSDLRRVLTYDDAPLQATAMLAELLTMPGGDRREARRLLDQLVEHKDFAELPANARAESLVLRALLARDPKKAAADLDAAVELVPGDAKHRLARADFHRRQDNLDQALADASAVIEMKPDEAPAYLLKAQILREQEKLDEALASAERASELAPDEPAPYQARGEIYRDRQDFDRAIEQFSKVLQIQPGLVLALIHRAEAYYNADKLDEALADVEAVLKEHPELAVAHGLRAQVLAGKQRLPEAIAEMEKLADALPDEPEYRMQLALYYLQNKQPRRAITAYTKVLELESDHFLALRSRGDAFLNIGDHASAAADFDKALALKSDDSPLLNNFAWVLATSPDDKVRNGARAIELATKACELTDYKQAHIVSTLAAAYAESGDFGAARKWSKKAVDLNKGSSDRTIAEELAKELASYEKEEPWRERQTQEERPSSEGESKKPDAGKPSQSVDAAKPIES